MTDPNPTPPVSDGVKGKSATELMSALLLRNYFPASGPDKGKKIPFDKVIEVSAKECRKMINKGIARFPGEDDDE